MRLPNNLKKIRLTSNAFLALVIIAAVSLFVVLLLLIKPASVPNASDELLALSSSVRKYYQKQMDYRGLNTSLAVEKGIVPKKLVHSKKIFSINGSEIILGADVRGSTIPPFVATFGVTYKNLDAKKCQNLLSSNFEASSGLSDITLLNDKTIIFTYGGQYPLPVSQKDAKKYCTTKNTIMFTFE